MIDLDVQPRKRNLALPWILAGPSLIAFLFFLTHRYTKDNSSLDTTTTTTTTAIGAINHHATAGCDWNNVDFNTPATSYNVTTNI